MAIHILKYPTLSRMNIAVVVFTVGLNMGGAWAQDVHIARFNAMPLMVNPANTGAFEGPARISAVYREQDNNVNVPYSVGGISVDMPVWKLKNGDVLAAGVQRMNEDLGLSEINKETNSFNAVSLAYHTRFGKRDRNYELAIGIQGTANAMFLNASNLFFNQTNNLITTFPYQSTDGRTMYNMNAGLLFIHHPLKNLSYQAGIAVSDLAGPNHGITRAQLTAVGADRKYYANASADWSPVPRLHISPSLYFESYAATPAYIAGSEVSYTLCENAERKPVVSVFMGIWARTGSITMYAAGLEVRGLRMGMGYEQKTLSETRESAYEATIRLIIPDRKKRAVAGA